MADGYDESSIVWADGFSFHDHNSIPDDPRYISTVGKFNIYDTFNGIDTPTGRTKWARPINYGTSGLDGVLAYLNGHKGTRAQINELDGPFAISDLMTSEAQSWDSSDYNSGANRAWRLWPVGALHMQFYCVPAVSFGDIFKLYDRSGNLKLKMELAGTTTVKFTDENGLQYTNTVSEDMTSNINYFKILFSANNTITATRNETFMSTQIPFDSADIAHYTYLQLTNAAFTSFVVKEADPNMVRMNVDAFYPPLISPPAYSAYKVDRRYSDINNLVYSAKFGFGTRYLSGIIDGYGNIVFAYDTIHVPFRVIEGDFTYAEASSGSSSMSLIALDSSGKVHTWSTKGLTDSGPSGSGYISVTSTYYGNSLFAIDSSGYIHAWGSDNLYDLITDTPTGSGYKKIVKIGYHSVVALHSSGTLTSWGGEAPSAIGSLPSDIDDVFPAEVSTFVAIDSSGTLWQAFGSDANSNSDHTYIHACGYNNYNTYGITSSGELVSYGYSILSPSTVLGTGYHAAYGWYRDTLMLKDEITNEANLIGNLAGGIKHTGEFSGDLDGSGLVTSRTEDRYLTTGLENNGVKPSDIYDSVLDVSAIIRANSTNSWSVCPAITLPGDTGFPAYKLPNGDLNNPFNRIENSAVGNSPANVIAPFGCYTNPENTSITNLDSSSLLVNVGTSVNDMQFIMGFNTPNKLTALTGRTTYDPTLDPIEQNMPDYPDCLGISGNTNDYDSEGNWPAIINRSGGLPLQDVIDIPPGATGASCKLSEVGNFDNDISTRYISNCYSCTNVLSFWLKVNSFTAIPSGEYHVILHSDPSRTGLYIDNTGTVFCYDGAYQSQILQINDNSWNYFGLILNRRYSYVRVNNELISSSAWLPSAIYQIQNLKFYGSEHMDVWFDEIRINPTYHSGRGQKPDAYNTPTVDTFCNEIADYTTVTNKAGIRMIDYLYNNPMG